MHQDKKKPPKGGFFKENLVLVRGRKPYFHLYQDMRTPRTDK